MNNTNKPGVSVICPFRNRVDLVCRAIESVINQSYDNYELIIIDDGSTQDTSILKKYTTSTKHRIILLRQKPYGASSARNNGIENALKEYIAFIDSDDTWDPNKLSIQLSIMVSKKVLFSYTSYHTYDNETNQTRRIVNGLYRYPWIAFHNRIATTCVIIRKNILENRPFNEQFRTGEDTALWSRIAKKNEPILIQQNLARIYTSNSTSARNNKLFKNALININKSLVDDKLVQLLHSIYIRIRFLFL